MQIVKSHEKMGNVLFYIGIALQTLLMTIGYGEWNIPFHGRIMQLAFVLFCLKILTTRYSKIEWVAMVLLGGLGIVSYIATRDEYVVSVIVMIFAAKNVDMKRVCKWMLGTVFVAVAVTAVLSLCGIGGIPVDVRDYGRGGVEARWSLGFGHANNLHGTIWYLFTLVVLTYFDKLKWGHYLFFTVVNVFLFSLTASRGGLIVTQTVFLGAVVLKYFPKTKKMTILYVLCGVEIIGVVGLTLVSAIVSPENIPILSKLDSMLTGRLHLIQWYADMSQWRWISTGVITPYVDDGWATIFYSYGYVIGIVFILFHFYLLNQIWRKKDGILLVVLVTSIFYIFMEATYTMNSTYLLCNLSYIIVMILLSKTSDSVEEESATTAI